MPIEAPEVLDIGELSTTIDHYNTRLSDNGTSTLGVFRLNGEAQFVVIETVQTNSRNVGSQPIHVGIEKFRIGFTQISQKVVTGLGDTLVDFGLVYGTYRPQHDV